MAERWRRRKSILSAQRSDSSARILSPRTSLERSSFVDRKSKISSRGSVLIIVMVTLIFTTLALVMFMEKASNDLLVDARVLVSKRLRSEAYSALETTLAVLEDFRQVGGLHNPSEGWGDPLAFASWTPTEGRTVEITFEDESGKISLPRADDRTLTDLFKSWQMQTSDAERLADALLGWMKPDHVYSTSISPDYDRGDLPYLPPARSLRSFDELGAIDVVRDMFYTDGVPNDLWHRFANAVSLYNFRQTNLNGARADVMAAVGQFDDIQQQKVNEYLTGTGAYRSMGPEWFTDAATVKTIAGSTGNPAGFTTTISALRINVTVHEGQSEFRLSAVVSPQGGGATTVQTTATSQRNQASASATQGNPTQPQPSSTPTASTNAAAASNAKKLNYPFTLLEIRENDEIPPPPPPPPADTP
jgi:type II secretory pathway component PulK